jgi:hypothetical protein
MSNIAIRNPILRGRTSPMTKDEAFGQLTGDEERAAMPEVSESPARPEPAEEELPPAGESVAEEVLPGEGVPVTEVTEEAEQEPGVAEATLAPEGVTTAPEEAVPPEPALAPEAVFPPEVLMPEAPSEEALPPEEAAPGEPAFTLDDVRELARGELARAQAGGHGPRGAGRTGPPAAGPPSRIVGRGAGGSRKRLHLQSSGMCVRLAFAVAAHLKPNGTNFSWLVLNETVRRAAPP